MCVVMCDLELFECIVYEFVQDLFVEGVCYIEVWFVLQFYVYDYFSFDEVLSLVNCGFEWVQKEYEVIEVVVSGKELFFCYVIIVCVMCMFIEVFSLYYVDFISVFDKWLQLKIYGVVLFFFVCFVVDVCDWFGLLVIGFDFVGVEVGNFVLDYVEVYQFVY